MVPRIRDSIVAMRLALAAAVAVLAVGSTAHADHARKRRYAHLGVTVGAGATYIVIETAVKPSIIPEDCHWCEPPGFDASVRSAVVWDHTERAATISDVTGFYLAPISAIGLLMVSSWDQRGLDRWLDDALPVVESAIATGLLQSLSKYLTRRQRPFVLHADPARPPENDDDMSFFSGHTATAFALATSAGTVAHLRGYRLEPVIWASGLTLAAATGYLRMAADRHWLSDVTVGALVGSAVGVTLPRLLHHDTLTVVPTGEGVLVSGTF
jgi:hypothetical protein